MTEKKTPKRRTKIKDLPKKDKKLSKDELNKVKGGMGTGFLLDGVVDKPKK